MAGKKHSASAVAVSNFYFPELDGLRFFAFLLVFVHHHPYFNTIPELKFLHDYGWIGVDLFFVLSAFLLTRLLLLEYKSFQTISFRKFYLRRICRIWPLYFFIIGLTVFLYLFEHGSLPGEYQWRVVGLLGFTDNFFTALQGYNPIPNTAHLWTITYEEQFYLFIPLLMLILLKQSVRIRTVFFVMIFLTFTMVRLWMINESFAHPAIWVLPFSHFESMAFGIVLGFGGFEFITRKLSPFVYFFLSIAAFSLLCSLPNLDKIGTDLMYSYLLIGFSTAFLFLAVYHSRIIKKVLSVGILVFLGKRSYGLYVYHILANEFAGQIILRQETFPKTLASTFYLSLVLTIIFAIISYMMIERPFLKLKHKFELIATRPV